MQSLCCTVLLLLLFPLSFTKNTESKPISDTADTTGQSIGLLIWHSADSHLKGKQVMFLIGLWSCSPHLREAILLKQVAGLIIIMSWALGKKTAATLAGVNSPYFAFLDDCLKWKVPADQMKQAHSLSANTARTGDTVISRRGEGDSQRIKAQI